MIVEIFETRTRDDPSPSRSAESTFAFLDRVDDPAFDRTRRLVNAWFEKFPIEGHTELRGRLQSSSNVDFNSALWELYLHECYQRLGYSLEYHPTLPDANTHPDSSGNA